MGETYPRQIVASRAPADGVPAAGPITLDIDLVEYPGSSFEIYGETDTNANLVFYGSIDGTTYRETFSVAVVAGTPYQNIFSNAYRHVRVAFDGPGVQLIELAGGR